MWLGVAASDGGHGEGESGFAAGGGLDPTSPWAPGRSLLHDAERLHPQPAHRWEDDLQE